MYSVKLVNTHFWLHTVGVVLYIVAMWISGVMQGLMWRAVNADGTLMYSFVQSLEASHPFYIMRFVGGVFIVAGMLVMAYNVFRTISAEKESLKLDAQAQLA
jgi:cytochrome c oxidase cbb3-type subunit 1